MQNGLSGANSEEGPSKDGVPFLYNKFYPGVTCSNPTASYVAVTVVALSLACSLVSRCPFTLFDLIKMNRRVKFLTCDLTRLAEAVERAAKLGTVKDEINAGWNALRKQSGFAVTHPIEGVKSLTQRLKKESTNKRARRSHGE